MLKKDYQERKQTMKNKLYIAAERVTGEDEFERHLEIAQQRNLGIEVQEFYLPDLMWGNWQARLDRYKELLQGFQGGLAIHNAFLSIDLVRRDLPRSYNFLYFQLYI